MDALHMVFAAMIGIAAATFIVSTVMIVRGRRATRPAHRGRHRGPQHNIGGHGSGRRRL